MAITAKFLADFDQFVGETKRADTALHGLGTSATKVAADSSTSFAGMGNTVRNLAGAFGVGLSIGAVVSFGKSVFDAASTIHDMGLKLGISSEAVQGFKFAAEQAGSTIDVVGTAITRMNVNLSEGKKGTIDALTAAGLEFSKIRSMKPEDAFLAIADAIQKMPDPMVRSEVALQLFGKSAAELLPAIMEGFRSASDGASKMSNETIKSLEAAQDAWSKLGTGVTIWTGTMIAKMIDLGEWYGRVSDAWSTGGQVAKKAAGDIELLPPVLVKSAEALVAVERAATPAAPAIDKVAAAVRRMIDNQSSHLDLIAPKLRDIANVDFKPTGAYAQILAEETGIREQAEALALVDTQMQENILVVGQYANQNKAAGEAVKAATGEAVQGYAAVAQQVAISGEAIREWITLQQYSTAANAIYAENKLFTSRSQLERVSKLPVGGGSSGGGGGGTTVQNTFNIVDTEANIARRVSEHLTRSIFQGTKVS